MRKSNYKYSSILLVLVLTTLLFSCKKDDDGGGDDGAGSGNSAVLVIESGAQTIQSNQPFTYTARIVESDGTSSVASGVTWSITEGTSATIAANGLLAISGAGVVTVKASVSHNGSTLTASAPLSILDAQAVFAVVPGAIVWPLGGSDIPLETIYLGSENPTFTYSSSNESIASVSSSGIVSFKNAGNCVITVTASLSGNPTVQVPMLVIGDPVVTLPVSRVEITKSNVGVGSVETFRNETTQLSAQAYNGSGEKVSANFAWSITDPTVATVNSSGNLTAKTIGRTTVQATADGITGQAEVFVYPDSVIIVNPFFVQSIQVGGSQQLQADLHLVNHNTFELEATPAQSPFTGASWDVLPTQVDITNPTVFLKPATVTNSGLVTIKQTANLGDVVFVVASFPQGQVEPGLSTLLIGF